MTEHKGTIALFIWSQVVILLQGMTIVDGLIVSGIVTGMTAQYIFSVERGLHTGFKIVMSTVLLTLFIIWPLLNYVDGKFIAGTLITIPRDSPLRIAVGTIAAFLSQELASIIRHKIPATLRIIPELLEVWVQSRLPLKSKKPTEKLTKGKVTERGKGEVTEKADEHKIP